MPPASTPVPTGAKPVHVESRSLPLSKNVVAPPPLDESHSQRAAAECRAAGKHLRSIQRQTAAQAREELLEQLWEAWTRCDSRDVWRISRLIAGCPLGPKRRSQLMAARLSETQVLEKCAATGPKGGFSATTVEWDQFMQSELGPTFQYEECPARPLEQRTAPDKDIPIELRTASYSLPAGEILDMQAAEIEITSAERYTWNRN